MNRLVQALLSATSIAVLVGCSAVRHSTKWKTEAFARVPAKVPAHYDPDSRGILTSSDGEWNFQYIAACPTGKNVPEAHWWMVWPTQTDKLAMRNGSPIKMLFTGTALRRSDWGKIRNATLEISRECFDTFGAYPQMVQPDLVYDAGGEDADSSKMIRQDLESAPPDSGQKLRVVKPPGGLWAKGDPEHPPYNPVWHLGDNYTQLAAAKAQARRQTGSAAGGIRIGVLDTGFDARSAMVPANTIGKHRDGDILGNTIAILGNSRRTISVYASRPGHSAGEQHGLKAMCVLASGHHTLENPKAKRGQQPLIDPELAKQGVEFGGAPDAVIVPVQIAPWVFSHSTANLAYGLDYASRQEGCDVIAMSHGGTPSPMWIDAVNAAYDRGTSIFAATGDYFNLPFINLGVGAPSATVYPAACRRVMAVAGITANGEPYGKADFKHHGLSFLLPWKWILMRGSYGADGAYRNIFHTSHENQRDKTDKAQIAQGGELRANPISTYAPNIAVPAPPEKKSGADTNLVNLNWGGTSSATPQAAAAAALWLACHRNEWENLPKSQRWQKAEAVYIAMLKTAQPAGTPPHSETREPDLYLGAGILRAAEMLNVSLQDARTTHMKSMLFWPRSSEGRLKESGMSRDWYDGERSGAAVLGWERNFPDYEFRADARTDDHVIRDPDKEQEALKNIYFNQLLVRQWNTGRIPRKKGTSTLSKVKPKTALWRLFSPDEEELIETARAWANKALD